MRFEIQAAALGIALAAAALTAIVARWTGWSARRRAIGEVATPAAEPYILYFTTPACSVCRLRQEPALAALAPCVRVDKIDALDRRDLAAKYRVYTVPTTVVVGRDGSANHVNYGFAPAERLRRQLREGVASVSAADRLNPLHAGPTAGLDSSP